MRAALEAHDDFRLVIAPEGTRAAVPRRRSGFWHLARAAHVPIALAYIDYAHREIGVGAWLATTDDADAEVGRMAAFDARFHGEAPAERRAAAALGRVADQGLRTLKSAGILNRSAGGSPRLTLASR